MAKSGIFDLFALTDQVAFVTGGGQGLGRAICVGFAEAGADIVTVARSIDKLEETAALVREQGRRCLPIQCDVTVKGQVDAAVQKASDEFGKIDILVNNVGASDNFYPAEEWPEDEWDRSINANLKSTFLCSQAVAKVMLEQGKGKILNISSGSGFHPNAGIVPYNVAKSALHILTRTLAIEWGDRGIWVNCMAVSGMRTPGSELRWALQRSKGRDLPDSPPAKPNWPPVTGGRVEPERYVPIALFLVSAASNHLTGEIMSPGGVALRRT